MSRTHKTTPAADGFSLPAEWAPHEGCWMAWPEFTDWWRDGAKPAQRAYTAVADAISQSGELVTMAVSERQFRYARTQLPAEVRLVQMSTTNVWARDTGPTFLLDREGERRGVDWRFNGFGGIEPAHLDDQFAQKVLEIERTDRYRAPIVVEGGGLHVDGEGTCMVTAAWLLHSNRNNDLEAGQIEEHLKAYLGVEKVISVKRGIPADKSGGHIDNLACWVEPGVIALSWTDDAKDPFHERCVEALGTLESTTDARGRKLRVEKLPTPGPLTFTEEEVMGADLGPRLNAPGDRMAASYVNFYIANESVILPLLDPETDDEAIAVLDRLFPGREVIGIPAREILLGGGNIHCITQQVPRRTAV